MNALGYMRCSGDGQISGDTWERQEAAIFRYAEAAGFRVVRWFRDEGVSGKTELLGREGLTSCIEHCREHGITTVLVESADRLARDMIVAELLIREFQKAGVQVIAASGDVNLTEGDDSNPTAKLIRQILNAIAEFDRNTIVLKLRAARDRKRERDGRCEGRKPYGDFPGEEVILARMRQWRNDGRTCEQIAAALNSEAVPTRIRGKWRAGTVAKILSRSVRHIPAPKLRSETASPSV